MENKVKEIWENIPTKTKNVVIRWSILFTIAMAGFWGSWYWINGSVPTTLGLFDVEVSRWWDILLLGMASMIIFLSMGLFSLILGEKEEPNYIDVDFHDPRLTGFMIIYLIGVVIMIIAMFPYGILAIGIMVPTIILAVIVFLLVWLWYKVKSLLLGRDLKDWLKGE